MQLPRSAQMAERGYPFDVAKVMEEAIRREKRKFPNTSITTGDLLDTLERRRKEGTLPTIHDLAGFVSAFARHRLLTWWDKKRRRAALLARAANEPASVVTASNTYAKTVLDDLTGVDAERVMVWFRSQLRQMEAATELRIEDVNQQGDLVVGYHRSPRRVALVLRGIYIDQVPQRQLAAQLQISTGQVSKDKTTGLRYLQLVLEKEGLL